MTKEAKTTDLTITADVFGIQTTRRMTKLDLKNVSITIQEGENEKLPLDVSNIKENGAPSITFAFGTLDRAAVKHIYRVVKPPMRYPHTPCNTCRIQIILSLTPRGDMIKTIMILNPTTILASNLSFREGFVNRFFEEISAEARRRLECNPGIEVPVTARDITSIP